MARAGSEKSRRDNFETYYKAHPEKLKGKSVDEAYAAMRRQAERDTRGGATPGDKYFVGPVARRVAAKSNANPSPTTPRRRGNPMTMDNTNPLAGIKNPLAYRDGKTPYQRMNSKLDQVGKAINGRAQTTVDKAHNDIAGKIKAVERRVRRKYAKF